MAGGIEVNHPPILVLLHAAIRGEISSQKMRGPLGTCFKDELGDELLAVPVVEETNLAQPFANGIGKGSAASVLKDSGECQIVVAGRFFGDFDLRPMPLDDANEVFACFV